MAEGSACCNAQADQYNSVKRAKARGSRSTEDTGIETHQIILERVLFTSNIVKSVENEWKAVNRANYLPSIDDDTSSVRLACIIYYVLVLVLATVINP